VNRVALTFDDGPHPIWTVEVLRVLAERAVPATFFVWGEQAVEHADVVEEMITAGHSVQPHCWRHRPHPELTAGQIRSDLDRVLMLLRRFGTPRPHLWRPPWGQLSQGVTRRVAHGRSLVLAGWNADSHDWDGRAGGVMYADVKARITELGDRDAVVLMHDSHVEARQRTHRRDCEGTLELVRRLVADEDLTFGPLAHGVPENLNEVPGRVASAQVERLRSWLKPGRA
jgi:peptidoglycan/xylan/chitin deacetylase (PgdA/CDA1 family)